MNKVSDQLIQQVEADIGTRGLNAVLGGMMQFEPELHQHLLESTSRLCRELSVPDQPAEQLKSQLLHLAGSAAEIALRAYSAEIRATAKSEFYLAKLRALRIRGREQRD